MDYKTFEPRQELSPLVKCYWTLVSPKEENPEKQTIVPDGCIEMIFHYGDLFYQYSGTGERVIQPRCFVIGQLTRPLEIQPTGETGVFSVRFHPGGFMPYATIPIKEMENNAVPLETLFGPDGKEISEKILNAKTTKQRVDLVEVFLTKRLTDDETKDRIIKSTVETILTANGQLPIDQLSRQLNINLRQLERKFSLAIGLSPKQLSKTVRLQASLKMLLNNQFTSLTALAYEGNYYDQAHFIKDFKELTGFTPKEFYKDNFAMSKRFYGSE
ncbi:MAG: AraC family transcriptional regulator [Cyclobacteriaceae bacterium]|nr:MAG: AraC family transcriptional regulator [Cyclobacteriaceae bacterium]